MAWRIHDSVQRGEIDNRERGVVRGRVWLDGCPEPIALELQGNACADLAGCLLTFENPRPTVALRPDAVLHREQRGSVGDLTASRKVRVFDLPFEEAYARLKQKLPVPEHMANCLYLEWFSEANGRVVIESTDYRLTVTAPAWSLSPADEEERAREAAAGFTGFMTKVSEALEAARHEPAPDKEWDEFDYEKFLRESDRRTDKYMELLDKYMDHPDREAIIAREMGWTVDEGEGGAPEPAEAAAADGERGELAREDMQRLWDEAEAAPLEPDPATEGRDWVRDEEGQIHHPLQRRVFNLALALDGRCDTLAEAEAQDPDVRAFVEELQIAAAKLAGALNGLAYGRDIQEGAFLVAYLKRALGHVHASQAGLERVADRRLFPAEDCAAWRRELLEIREEILRLMDEFRGRG